MVRHACGLGIIAVLLVSCVTVAPTPPNLYIENLPQSLVTPLTLEERIQMQEAWDYLRQGWLDKAERAFLRLGPESPLYDLGLGYVFLLRDDFSSAEGYFRLAIEENPGSLLAHLGLTQLYQKTGDEDKIFNALREVLKIEPANFWAKEGYESLKIRKTERAIEAARAAIARGETESGKESYLRALHYSPESIPAHLALARLYRDEERLSSALVHLKAASSIEPDNIGILSAYAETLTEAREYEQSLEIYQRILGLDAEDKLAQERIETLRNRLGIVEIPSLYNAIPLAPAITREDLAALLAVKLKDVLGETSSQPPIIVDISTSWASKFILKASSLGLLEVYPNHAFQPKRNVTREDLAMTLLKVIHHLEGQGHRFIPQIPLEMIEIQDIVPDHYSYRTVRQILSYQIMELYPDKTFRPTLTVSGADAVRTFDILLALVR
ncbi:MAG: S-layer homology domain-containing protein [Candidatus Aminicenantes bacterium]|nr:S-layer homology domain-containing protein [Candidatus Aminicenantes bacterium]